MGELTMSTNIAEDIKRWTVRRKSELHASHATLDCYNYRWSHQALKKKTRAEAFALAA
jgi:hypothetical protein